PQVGLRAVRRGGPLAVLVGLLGHGRGRNGLILGQRRLGVVTLHKALRVLRIRLSASVTLAFAAGSTEGSGAFGLRPRRFLPVACSCAFRSLTRACRWAASRAASSSSRHLHAFSRSSRLWR